MKPTRRNPLFANFFRGNTLATAVVISVAALSSAQAATVYWDSNGAIAGAGATPAGTWGTSAFWTSAVNGTTTVPVAWVSGNVAVFSAGTDATNAYNVALNGTITIGGLTVEEGTPTITASGTALSLSGAAPFVITGRCIVNSVITGSGIAKSGTGTLVIGGAANTFTSNITVSGGALEMTSGSNGNATSAPLGIFTGGTAYKTVTLSNGGIFRPMATYNSNTPSAAAPGNGYVFSLSTGGGTFDVPTGVTLTLDDGAGAGTGTGNAQLQGAGALTKTGVGTLSLGNGTSDFNTYSGGITVSDGILLARVASALGSGSSIVVENAANPGASDSNILQILGGITHGTGKTLTLRNNSTTNIANARTVLENQSGNNTWAGGIVFDQGTNQTLTSTAGILTLSGTLSSSGTPSTSVFLRGASNGVITGGMFVGTTGLYKTDAGTWTISSSGNSNGIVRVAAGTLILNNTNAVSSSTTLAFGEGNANTGILTINAGFTQEFASISNDATSTATATQLINGGGSITTGSTNRTYNISDPAAADDLTINTPILGSGGFTKTGSGTLVLNNSAVTGPVTVGAGTLRGTPSFASGLTLTAGGTFTPGTTASGVTIPTPTLTFGTGATTLNMNAGTGGDRINVTATNGLTANGTTTINVARFGGSLPVGTYPLINYVGSIQGSGGFALGTVPPHLTANITTTGSAVSLNVTSSDYFQWTGTTNGIWDTTTANNWNLFSTSAPVLYQNGEAITFGDTGLNPNVVVANAISPGWITFSNSLTGPAWRITGAAINGIGGITKSNTGLATIANTVDLTGNVLVQGGTLEIDHDTGSLTSAASVDLSSGATLLLSKDNGDFTFDRSLTGNGTVKIDPVTSTTGPGSRTVTLSGTNTGFSGLFKLTPSGTVAANGSFRTAGTTSQANLGSSVIDVDAGAQLWFTGSISNNITITGVGYSEAQGNSPATLATSVSGASLTVPGFTYGGVGALRMDGATITGNVTLEGNAEIGAFNATGTISGTITNTASSDTLVVGGGSGGTTLILSGDATGLERIWVNGGGTGGTNTLQIGNNGTTGTLASNVDVILFNDGAGAALRVNRSDGFTLEPGQNIIAAHNGTAANLAKVSLQTNVTGAGFSIGTAGTNVVDLSDGINGGNISVGTTLTNAILNIDAGATIETRYLGVGENGGFSASVNQTGGSVAINGANTDGNNNLRLGHYGAETSTYTLTGGSISFGSTPSATTPATAGIAEVAGGIYVGIDGTGIFNQSGGTVTTNYVVLDNRGDTGGTDQYNLSGGTLNLSSTWGIIRRNSSEFNFSGGTIRNSGSGITADINAQLIVSNSPVLDTNGATNGLSLAQGITGSGTLTAQGGGTVFLNGTSTFTGTLSISDATALGGTGAFPSTASVTNVSPGATAAYGSAGTLTLGDPGAGTTTTTISGTATFDLNAVDPVNGNDKVAVNDDLNLTGSTILPRFYNGVPTGGTYTLYTYTGTLTGVPVLDPAFTGVSPSLNFSIDTITVPGVVSLVVTGSSPSLTWFGDGAGNVWDVNTTANWSGSSNFYQLSAVTFDDIGSDVPSVSLTGTLIPSTVLVDTSSKSYTFAGSGLIGGGAKLAKSGSSQLTLVTNNNYTGTTDVFSGILQVGNGGTTGSIGSGLTIFDAGSELQFNHSDSISQTAVFGGGGTLVQEGSGTLTLQNANTIAGPIHVDSGIVKAANVAAFGTSSGITVASGGQVNLNGILFGTTRGYTYRIAGNGPDSRGALINELVNLNQNAAVLNLTLTGNASVGAYGATGEGNRFDIGFNGTVGTIDGGGFTLTKLGDSMVNARGPATNISYVVAAGTLRVETTASALGSTSVTVNDGAKLDSYGALTPTVPALTFGNNTSLTSSNLVATWAAAITLNGTTTIGGAGTTPGVTLSGIVSGASGAIIKAADATTLILSGNNSYAGGTTTYGGTVQTNANNALGTGAVLLNNTAVAGKLVINGGVTVPNNITFGTGTNLLGVSGRGQLEQTGTGQSIMTGTVTVNSGFVNGGTFWGSNTVGNELVFQGPIILNAAPNLRDGRAIFSGGGTGNGRNFSVGGTMLLGANNGLPTDMGLFVGDSAGGTFDLAGFNQTLAALTKGNNAANVTNSSATTASTLTLNIASGTNTYAGNWAGNLLSVTKTGAGTLVMSTAGTIGGNVLVSQGVLSATAQNTGLGQQLAARTITVSSGATLALGTNNVFGNGATALTALPAVVINGGTLTANNYDVIGNLTLNGATVTDTRTGTPGTNFQAFEYKGSVTVGGTSPSTISSPLLFPNHLVGNITFNVADATTSAAADLTVSTPLINASSDNASVAGALTKSGAGTMVLSAVNAYTGSTVVNAGTLNLADNGQLRFVLGATSGTNNSLTGAGTAVLDGDFAIDTTAAAALTTGTWVLENVTSLTGAYGSTFTVVNPDGSPWTNAGSDKWIKVVGTKIWIFDETTGTLILTQSAFMAWSATHAGGGNAAGDFDGDGVSNGLEWVLGGNETTKDLSKLPGVSSSSGNLIFTFIRDQQSISADTTVSIQVGTSLTAWPDVYAVPGTAGTSGSPGTVTVTKDSPVAGKDTVTLSVAMSPDTKKFARLKVTTTP